MDAKLRQIVHDAALSLNATSAEEEAWIAALKENQLTSVRSVARLQTGELPPAVGSGLPLKAFSIISQKSKQVRGLSWVWILLVVGLLSLCALGFWYFGLPLLRDGVPAPEQQKHRHPDDHQPRHAKHGNHTNNNTDHSRVVRPDSPEKSQSKTKMPLREGVHHHPRPDSPLPQSEEEAEKSKSKTKKPLSTQDL